MRVADERPEPLEQALLDGAIQAAARRPVGVDDPLFPIRRAEGLVVAHRVGTEWLEVLLERLRRGR